MARDDSICIEKGDQEMMTSNETALLGENTEKGIVKLDESRAKNVVDKFRDVERRFSSDSAHVQAAKPTNYWDTMIHMIKGNTGFGVLAMGYAYKDGGMLLTTMIIFAVGSLACYNQYILIVIANDCKSRYKIMRKITFSETIGLVFENEPKFCKYAKLVKFCIKQFIIYSQLGFCSVYFIFVCESMKQFTDKYGWNINIHMMMVIFFPLIWLTAMIRELKYLVPLSSVANACSFTALGLIVYSNLTGISGAREINFIGEWSHIPLAFGTVVYSLEGISLALPLQENMKKPEQFLGPCGVLNSSLAIVTILVVLMGSTGYFKYGADIKDSITLNLNADHLLTQAVIVLMSVSILCSYALQFYIPVVLLLPDLMKYSFTTRFTQNHVHEYGLRSGLCLCTFLVCELIPYINLFVSLIGSVGGSFLALIFTPLADIAMRKKCKYGRFYWRIWLDGISIAIGMFGVFLGGFFSLKGIQEAVMADLGWISKLQTQTNTTAIAIPP